MTDYELMDMLGRALAYGETDQLDRAAVGHLFGKAPGSAVLAGIANIHRNCRRSSPLRGENSLAMGEYSVNIHP